MKNIKNLKHTSTFVRYKDLDALRGIAALMVVVFHLGVLRPEPINAFFWGRAGVDMFFIISGFVIFMSIKKVSNVKEFAISRFARLFPAYWFCVTLVAAIQFIALKLNFVHSTSTNISWLKYFANLTMFQKYLGFENVDGSYWTLLVEMIFYIGIAVLLGLNKIKNIFNFGWVILIIILINVLLANAYPAYPFKQINFWFPMFSYFSLFFAGIMFYKLLTEQGDKLKISITILACYLIQVKTYFSLLDASTNINPIYYSIVLTLIFVTFILFINQKISFITNSVTLFLGKISFSIYLIHMYLGVNIMLAGLERILNLPFFISFIITISAIISFAFLINKYIEVPGGKFLKAKLKANAS